MTYPRTPNNAGEHVGPDGRIRISRHRADAIRDRILQGMNTMARRQDFDAVIPSQKDYGKVIDAALESLFDVEPRPALKPRVILTEDAKDALVDLLIGAANGDHVIATSTTPRLSAANLIDHYLDVTDA